MQENLILHSTAMAQWHALVKEARQYSSINLSEDLESYLVFLLMRFSKNPDITNSILALDFLQNLRGTRHENIQMLQEVGDKCLLFAGLFPGRAKRRRVQISYYISLGQSAYSSLSECRQNQLSKLFGKLCHHFVSLMDVLHSLRELDPKAYKLDLLEAAELWNSRKSQYAFKKITSVSQGFLIPNHLFNAQHKH